MLAEYAAAKIKCQAIEMSIVKGLALNTLVVIPRLDDANAKVSNDLYEYLHTRQGMDGAFHKGDHLIWSLIVEPDTKGICDMWGFEQTSSLRIQTCVDSYLLGV